MSQDQAIEVLEEEVRLLKSDVKTLLLDIRERYLDYRYPFRFEKAGEVIGYGVGDRVEWSPKRATDSYDYSKEADMAKAEQTLSEREESEMIKPEKASSCPEAVHEESKGCGRLDLVTIVGLAQWVEEGMAMIGREKLEALVEVCQMSGRLRPELRDAIMRLARSYPAENAGGQATGRDYLAILVKLENLLGNSTQGETALLSILSDRSVKKDKAWTKQ